MEESVLEKKKLRKYIIESRLNLSPKEVEQKSLAITEKLLSEQIFQDAKTIMLYIDFRNEVKTEHIIKEALKRGKKVFVPVTDLKNKKLIPTEIKDYPGDLIEGTYGVLVPRQGYEASPKELDLIIVPGVGFDQKGNRLGYGGGFYDRFLPKTRQGIYFLAIAYELQIKSNVYSESHDQPVHYIITEKQVIKNV